MERYPQITGWGEYLPGRRLTNEQLVPLLKPQIHDINSDWILRRTGIEERRIAAHGETTTRLAINAALKALEVANLDPRNIHEIIVATISPDSACPSTACLVQQGIGATVDTSAYDMAAACSGFLYGLANAWAKIQAGMIDNALVIGAERMSRKVNYRDPQTSILFADGAGAVVIQNTDEPKREAIFRLKSDGAKGNLIFIPASNDESLASLDDPSFDPSISGFQYVQMDGREVFVNAIKLMTKTSLEMMEEAGLTFDDIDLVIFHQANLRILKAIAENIGLPPNKTFTNIQMYGNTSAASIPIALAEAAGQGLYTPNKNLLLVAIGGGITYGASLIFGREKLPTL